MDRAGVVVDGAVVDRVLPRQPRVAGGLQRDEDLLELLARADLLEHVELAALGHRHVLGVALRELLAVQLVEVGDLERVEEVPVVVVLHALHELVADPHRGVGGAGAAVGVTRVLTQVEELGEVHVPVLHVEAQGTELLAAAADRAQHRVDRVHERDRPGRGRVVRADGRALGAQLGDREADAAGALGQPHDVAHALGDVLDVVLHLHDEAVRQLGVARAGVDEGRAGGEVLELRHLRVEGDGVRGGVGLVERQAHGHAHPEVLRGLEGLAVARLDAVAVVEGDDADVLQQLVVLGVEHVGEGVEVEQLGEAGVEQHLVDAATDVVGEVRAVQLAQLGGVLVVAEDALVDGLEQEARGDDVEGGVVLDVLQGDLDDRLVELLGGDAVEQRQLELARDLRDPRDLVGQALGRALDRQVDLVGVVRLTASIALHHGDAAHVPTLPLGASPALVSRGPAQPPAVGKSPENRASRAVPLARCNHYISGV